MVNGYFTDVQSAGFFAETDHHNVHQIYSMDIGYNRGWTTRPRPIVHVNEDKLALGVIMKSLFTVAPVTH